jgi:SAM-dependent methyltransferase
VITGVLVTAAGLGLALVRAFRWQFLLRRIGVRHPLRYSISRAVGSDVLALVTPFAAGILVRPWLASGPTSPRIPRLLAIAADIGFDLAALMVLAGQSSRLPLAAGSIGIAIIAVVGARWLAAVRANRTGERTWPLPFGLTAVLWGLIGSLAGWGGALAITATLTGREPAGGALLAQQILAAAGKPLPMAVALWRAHGERGWSVVLLATLAVAGALAWRYAVQIHLNKWSPEPVVRTSLHFDEISEAYLAQWPRHIWEILIRRRLDHLSNAVGPPEVAGLGLDLGCGLGLQALGMRERGYSVAGIDPSRNLLVYARERGLPVIAGSALALPVALDALGFVYALGVVHHLPDPGAQRKALLHAAHALKAGGRMVVQETNPRNPLFRFYMGYLFPLLKVIDEGTEWWIHPTAWPLGAPLEVERVDYFTFLPDFLPQFLLGVGRPAERWLEQSPLRPWSVHYMVVMRKPD